jgi:hypothetical protein
MQDIINYYIVPPGNLCVRDMNGHFRAATENETAQFFKRKIRLQTIRAWGSSYGKSSYQAA